MNCKVVMLGIGAVGKSAFSIQFVQGKFVDDYDPTIEANYKRSVVVDEKTVQLEIFDTAGMERFDTLMATTLRNGDVFIFLYDITDVQSFDSIKELYNDLLRTLNKDNCACVICGNKCDLEDRREVNTEDGKNFAASIKADFFETSAKTCQNVEAAFHAAIRKAWEYDPNYKQDKTKDEKKKKEKKGFCLLI